MRHLLLLACLAGLASATTFSVGGSPCTWGPSYWCQGFPSARECGATQHCIDRVWSQRQLPVDDDDVCTICKNMVKEARDTLRSNETQVCKPWAYRGTCP